LLKQHTAGHHHIGPGEVALAELLGVAIDQPDVPGLGQQRRHSDQAERDSGITGTHEFAGFREIPEGIRHEARIDHQHIAGGRRRQSCYVATLLFQGACYYVIEIT